MVSMTSSVNKEPAIPTSCHNEPLTQLATPSAAMTCDLSTRFLSCRGYKLLARGGH